ncbi:Taurine import ATP-binding protein TauB [Gemmobacter aquaticus]|uniref:Taurine import ATP-binding protein TauB n=1 Tax=Gemmobacter aquaticus TaxID=490185 RepID=A0A917YNQ9_9RHOB|nr:ABC transporter ATP-binding protein [Gemmobacter aquaticus]GGO39117.1 Taurine import ATP-binding protein TauB [Gemmobacter aquaticus]
MTLLSLHDLSMRFPTPEGRETLALCDISLSIGKGELVAIVGPSGCGKTTLLSILAGFQRQSSGQALLNGRPIAGPGRDRGIVFQQGALFEWMSVARNVDFGPRMGGAPRASREALVRRLLAQVGLQGYADKAVWQLSGGMQQRVALARCLAGDPDLILMDEPLGALDALTREKMQSLVLDLWQDTGKTIILITHSVDEALLLGERLIVMAPRPGRILQDLRLPFARMAAGGDLRAVKQSRAFQSRREEILSTIWGLEEEIMGRPEAAE